MKSKVVALLLAVLMITALLPFGAAAAKEHPIYCVQRSDKVVSLTFDASWGDDHTQALLNTLNRYQVKATFFLVSIWVDDYPHWVKTLFDNGMEIMNHSNDTVIRAIRDLGVTPIQWDVDSLDWTGNSASDIAGRVLSKVKPGSIVLCHNDGAHTVEALPEIIETLLARGYSIVPVSQNIYAGSYTIDASGTQIPLAPAAPVLSMDGGTMTMTCSTEGATIHYTTDGSAPTASSTRYTGPVTVPKGTTVRACAARAGMDLSPVTALTYSANGNVMRDVAVTDWHYEALDRAVSMGVINGTAPEVMSPNTALTRAMLVTMLHRLAGSPSSDAAVPFTDTDAKQYYYAPLCWAVQNGIVTGYENNTFRPGNVITRAELSTMLARYLRSLGHALPEDLSVLKPFSDAGSIPDWARESMAAMAALGIVKGYENGTIGAERSATRAEAVTMLLRAADLPEPQITEK